MSKRCIQCRNPFTFSEHMEGLLAEHPAERDVFENTCASCFMKNVAAFIDPENIDKELGVVEGVPLPESLEDDDMLVEDRIARWREEECGSETEPVVHLICDAEEELRKLRKKAINYERAYDALHKDFCRTSDIAEKNLCDLQDELAKAETETGPGRTTSEGRP